MPTQPVNLPPDLAPLALPLPGDQPCGPDLEYDPRFFGLEQQLEASQRAALLPAVGRGAPPTDWSAVQSNLLSLLAETRDLRLGLHLVRARLRLDGPRAAAGAVELLRVWADTLWAELNPRQDPDDPDPEWARAAALSALWHPQGLQADWPAADGTAVDVEGWSALARAVWALAQAVDSHAPDLLYARGLPSFLMPWLGDRALKADEPPPAPAPLAEPTPEQTAAVESWLSSVAQWQAGMPEREQAQALRRHRREREPSLALLLQELKDDRDATEPAVPGAAPP